MTAVSAADEDLLLVAVCAGPRCSALRRLHDPSASEAGVPGRSLRDAVRGRRRSVLVTTGCLGPCDRGCVVAVGTGASAPGALSWTQPPVALGLVELPGRAEQLADWVAGPAPDPATLPLGLRGGPD